MYCTTAEVLGKIRDDMIDAIYLTEAYVKSRYLSAESFLHLF